jgi:hypothetical protein
MDRGGEGMNNEPVAWMSQGGDVSRSKDYFEEMGFKDLIPLYTHPVKEQDTDCQYCKQGCIRCDARKQLTDEEIRHIQAICHLKDVGYDNFIMRFARAILRKAQEK